MAGYRSPDIIKDECFRKLYEHGFVNRDSRELNPQLFARTFTNDIYPERGYVIVYTGKEAGMNGIALMCDVGCDARVNVAATYDNPFSMYKSVPIEVFIDIVCGHPTNEWIERFHAYDVKNTLEVLDGA